MRFILHINLKTGSQLPVYREQVDQGLIEKAGLLLPMVLTANVPTGELDYDLRLVSYGSKCCSGNIFSQTVVPAVTLFIAGHSKCGSTMWRTLAADQHKKCPPEPYLAYRWHTDKIDSLTDFIQALGFAWMDSLKKR